MKARNVLPPGFYGHLLRVAVGDELQLVFDERRLGSWGGLRATFYEDVDAVASAYFHVVERLAALAVHVQAVASLRVFEADV